MGTKIVELWAENTRVLKLVRIQPGAGNVILGGNNEAGKTTVLDDIELLFAGAGSDKMPTVPIRTGQTTARTGVKLSSGLTLEREWSAAGTRLIVKGSDGKKLPGGPQAIADKFFSSVAFDPLEFADKMDAKKQAEVLRKLVGIDFSEVDAKRAQLYSEREDHGRELSRRKGQLAAMPEVIGAPDAEVSVADLVKAKDAADAVNRANASKRSTLESASEAVDSLAEVVRQKERELQEAKTVLASAEARKVEAAMAAHGLSDVETASIVSRISSAEDTNRRFRAARERAAVAAEVERMDTERRDMTAKLSAIDAEKEHALSAVKWPVDGLGFSSDGVTYKGLPFAQASKAARYKVSIAIGALLNPELDVMLVRDASLLDHKSMDILSELSSEKDKQLWIERVGDNDVGALILEDGEIVGRVTEPGKVEPIAEGK